MLNSGESIKVASIFVLFLASLAGISLPLFCQSQWLTKVLPVLNSLAGGVMLGLAFIHLLPEAEDKLSQVVPDYPLANTLAALGVFLVLILQQITMMYSSPKNVSSNKDISAPTIPITKDVLTEKMGASSRSQHAMESNNHLNCDHSHDHHHNNCCSHHSNHDVVVELPIIYPSNETVDHDHSHGHEHVHDEYCNHASPTEQNTSSYDHYHYHETDTEYQHEATATKSVPCPHHGHCDGHDHAIAFHVVLQAHSVRDLVNAYALEISTAIHSFIIGFDLGIMDSADAKGISILFIALVFHQLVEGIGMGSILQSSRDLLSTWKMMTFITIFSITISCGVIMGYFVNSDDNVDIQNGVEGAATSIAAGSMFFVSLSELVGNYFNKKEFEEQHMLKLMMITGFGAGIAMMAIIGIWA